MTINYDLIDKGSESSKQYTFSIVPEKIIHMNNGIKYYFVEAEFNDRKVIINAYGPQAEELFKEVQTFIFEK